MNEIPTTREQAFVEIAELKIQRLLSDLADHLAFEGTHISSVEVDTRNFRTEIRTEGRK